MSPAGHKHTGHRTLLNNSRRSLCFICEMCDVFKSGTIWTAGRGVVQDGGGVERFKGNARSSQKISHSKPSPSNKQNPQNGMCLCVAMTCRNGFRSTFQPLSQLCYMSPYNIADAAMHSITSSYAANVWIRMGHSRDHRGWSNIAYVPQIYLYKYPNPKCDKATRISGLKPGRVNI